MYLFGGLIKELETLASIPNVSGGLHILADLYKCKNKSILVDHSIFIENLNKLIIDSGMKPFGQLIKYFGEENNSGYTLIIGLEESHISFHTFPLIEEDEKCAIDVYTCNISKDNGNGCKRIYEYLVQLFEPEAIYNLRFVERS